MDPVPGRGGAHEGLVHVLGQEQARVDQVAGGGLDDGQEAVAVAAKMLKDHLSIYINFEDRMETEPETGDGEDEKLREYLDRSIDELDLSVRSYNCLKNAGIETVRQLVQKSESELLKTKNFGRKSLNEIKEILADMSLTLGMRVGGATVSRI